MTSIPRVTRNSALQKTTIQGHSIERARPSTRRRAITRQARRDALHHSQMGGNTRTRHPARVVEENERTTRFLSASPACSGPAPERGEIIALTGHLARE